MDGLTEHDLVHRQGDDVLAGITAGAGVGNLVKQLEDGAAVNVAGEIGHVRRHQHSHGELVFGQMHCSDPERKTARDGKPSLAVV